jgi:hypothetical protein
MVTPEPLDFSQNPAPARLDVCFVSKQWLILGDGIVRTLGIARLCNP